MKLKLLPSTISTHSFALRDFNYNASSSSSSSSVHRHKHNFIVASKSKKHRRNDAKGSNSQPSPPRITSNAKQSLRILKACKELEKRKSTTPRPSTSYRKKKVEKENIHDPPSSLDDTDELVIIDDSVPVMLVDGYNVCGYWMKLKEYFMSGRLELARDHLIDELKTFCMVRDFKVVVVFDAMMSGFPSHKQCSHGIDIVFTSKISADTWIEREVIALKEEGCSKIWVVTSDRCEQESVYFSGAAVWSCKTLVKEIEQSHKEVGERLLEHSSPLFKGMLKHSLSTEVVDALRNLREKLSENERRRISNSNSCKRI